MPRILDQWPEPERPRSRLLQFLDGRVYELRRGEDFDAKPGTLRSNLQAQAKKLGGRARTRHLIRDGVDYVVVQFMRRPGRRPASDR